MNDQLLNAHIAKAHFGWRVVKRNDKMVLVTPKGKFETPPDFVTENDKVTEKKEDGWIFAGRNR